MFYFGATMMNVLMFYAFMDFTIQDTMMMGADYYQTEYEIASLVAEGKVPIGVGANTKIRCD